MQILLFSREQSERINGVHIAVTGKGQPVEYTAILDESDKRSLAEYFERHKRAEKRARVPEVRVVRTAAGKAVNKMHWDEWGYRP